MYASTEAVVREACPKPATYKDGCIPQLLAYKAHITALTEIRSKWELGQVAVGIGQQIDLWVSTNWIALASEGIAPVPGCLPRPPTKILAHDKYRRPK